MHTRARVLFFCAAAILLALVLIIFWRTYPEVAYGTAKNDTPANVAVRRNIIPPEQLMGDDIAPVDMPPAEAPLRESLDQLEELARRGSSVAACRIAAGLDFCRHLPAWRQEHDLWLAQRNLALGLSTSNGDAAGIDVFNAEFERELGLREARLRRMEARCAGVESPHASSLISRWRGAAFAGSAPAIRHYASGNVFSWDSIVAVTSELQAWRTEAPRLALGLAEQGDLQMILLLAASYSPLPRDGKPLLAQAMPSDWALALSLYRRASEALRNQDSMVANELRSSIDREIEQLEHASDEHIQREALDAARDVIDDWEQVDLTTDLAQVSIYAGTPGSQIEPCDKESRDARID